MLRKIDLLLKKCKGKTTIQKFQDLTKKVEQLARMDLDLFMRGNNIPYRVTIANNIPKEEWDKIPDGGTDVRVEHEDPDQLGKLFYVAVMETRKPLDTTMTFLNYYSQTISVRVKGDDYHNPIFVADGRIRWNGALEDHLREMEHKEIREKNKESWRQSL